MSYTSIFNVKPKKDNKQEFCKRIVRFLNEIKYVEDCYVYNDGKKLINIMFKYNKLNKGYINIDDLLNEADKPYSNIFKLCNRISRTL